MREGKAVHIVWCGNVRMCSGTVCNDGGEGATIEDAMKDLKKKFEEKEV
jgi:NADH:ubiquinone oxidoreductase subunit E